MARPTHRAYTVIKRDGKDNDGKDKEDFWQNIGVAFAHDDGQGFNILLQALPLDGKIVLRVYKDDEDDKPKKKEHYKGR